MPSRSVREVSIYGPTDIHYFDVASLFYKACNILNLLDICLFTLIVSVIWHRHNLLVFDSHISPQLDPILVGSILD